MVSYIDQENNDEDQVSLLTPPLNASTQEPIYPPNVMGEQKDEHVNRARIRRKSETDKQDELHWIEFLRKSGNYFYHSNFDPQHMYLNGYQVLTPPELQMRDWDQSVLDMIHCDPYQGSKHTLFDIERFVHYFIDFDGTQYILVK